MPWTPKTWRSETNPLGPPAAGTPTPLTGPAISAEFTNAKNYVDERGFLTVGGVLTWSPPALTTPTTITLTTETYHQLDNTLDYIIVFPNSTRTTGLQLEGGKNIVIIGGAANANSGASAGMIYVTDNGTNGAVHAGRVIHIEGQNIAVPASTDGIAIDCPSAIVQIQNCLVTGVAGQSSGFHGDCVQNYSGAQEVRIDKFTGTSMYQGISMFAPAAGGTISIAHMYRCNVRYSSAPIDAFTQLLYFAGTTSNYTPIELRDFWVANGRSGQSAINAVYPDNTATAPLTAVYDSNKNVSWPNLPNVTGVVHPGIPPGGDFVKAADVGLGYMSPGYAQ